MFHDAKNPPVVRPGLEGERAPVLALATEKTISQSQQVKHAVNQ
jgi:hypothetical protein